MIIVLAWLVCFIVVLFWVFRAIAAIEDGLDDVRRIRIAIEAAQEAAMKEKS